MPGKVDKTTQNTRSNEKSAGCAGIIRHFATAPTETIVEVGQNRAFQGKSRRKNYDKNTIHLPRQYTNIGNEGGLNKGI